MCHLTNARNLSCYGVLVTTAENPHSLVFVPEKILSDKVLKIKYLLLRNISSSSLPVKLVVKPHSYANHTY